MELFDRIADAHARWNVLRHPFYQRWSAGELTPRELGLYATEYRHAVVALADQSVAAAALAAELKPHADEEIAHIRLWDDFATAFGADRERPPRAETVACARTWTAGDTLVQRLGVLYAIEQAQPAISQTKLDGLTEHYGVRADESTATYFTVHATRDREHAAEARRMLTQRLDGSAAETDGVVAHAEAALATNWRLLDGVERLIED
jgi:pyrroloquinoline-quinone synthase